MLTSLASLLRSLANRGRLFWLDLRGIPLPPGTILGSGVEFVPGVAGGRRGLIQAGDACRLSTGVLLHAYGGEIRLGANVFLGPGTVIYGHGGVEIGDACLIAMHCRILSSNHAVPPSGTEIRSQPDELRPTKIGRDVWLGAGVTVLGGVTLGDGCVVGAGAVVTKSLPPGAIAHGVPAQVHGFRPAAPGA